MVILTVQRRADITEPDTCGKNEDGDASSPNCHSTYR